MRRSSVLALVLVVCCIALTSGILSVKGEPGAVGDTEDMSVTLMVSPSEAKPGAVVILYTLVANKLNDQLERVIISVVLSSGWQVTPASLELTNIAGRGAKFGAFEISVPSNANSGVYSVIVTVESANSNVIATLDLPVKTDLPPISVAIAGFFASPLGIGAWFAIVTGAVGSYLKWFFDRRNLTRTFKNEVAKSMTAKVLENLEKYYYHLCGATAGLASNLQEYNKAPTEDNAMNAFYSFCIRMSVSKSVATQSVLFIMKDHDAEEQLVKLDEEIGDEFKNKLRLKNIDEQLIERYVPINMSKDKFMELLKNRKTRKLWAACSAKFSKWLNDEKKSVNKVIESAKNYNGLFEEQITKIHQPWYEATGPR